jgi:hypothetical protein
MSLKVKQETILKGKDWWQWAVWLDGSSKELDKISYVVYTLHPTFPTPVRRVDNRKEKFRLDSAGWGEFEIYLDIVYKDGQTRKRKHWLKLEYAKPEKRAVGMRQAAMESVSAKKPVLFLSSTVADADVAGIMRRALSKYDITVVPPEELLAGVPLEKMVGEMISNADIAVFVISGRPSLWMNHEIEAALAHKVRMIVPILVGAETELPSSLREFQSVQVSSLSEIEKVAQQIAKTSLSKK